MNKKLIYGASSLMLLSGLGFTSCQSDNILSGDDNAKGSYILTVKASKGDDKTRTEFEEKDGNLISTWNAGDKLYVVDGSGVIGTVTLVSGAGTPDGVFEGDNLPITAETNALSLWYINDDIKNGTKSYTYRNASQNGTFDSMADMDVMSVIVPNTKNGSLTVNAENKTAEMTANLERRVAEAHFTLSFSDGNVLKTGDVITISAAGTDKRLFTQNKFNLVQLSTTVSNPNSESITVTKTEDGNDLYLTMIHGTVSLKFTVTTSSGKTYNGELGEHPWEAGQYVRKSNGDGTYSGVEVKMVAEDIIDHSKNPLLKWAEGNLVYDKSTGKSSISTDPYAGGSLYQWGKNLGFEDYVDAMGAYNSSNGAYSYGTYNASYFSGEGFETDGSDGYSRHSQRYTTASQVAGAGKKMFMIGDLSKDSSADAINGGDYYVWSTDGASYSWSKDLSNWEKRSEICGYSESVAPENYRLPTKADFMEIFPKAVINTSTYGLANALNNKSELRELGTGEKYAITWALSSTSKRYVTIKCLMVPADFEESALSTINWSDNNVVTRIFSATGGVDVYCHKYINNQYKTLEVARPVPFGTWNADVVFYPNAYNPIYWSVKMFNFVDAGKTNEGAYWCADENMIFRFRDNQNLFGSANSNSLFGASYQPKQNAFAIRVIKK